MRTTNKKISTNKLKTLTLVENGLVLENTINEKTTHLLSELDKIYILKLKLSQVQKTGIIFLFFIIISILKVYVPIEILFFTLFLLIFLTVTMNSYRWYQIHLLPQL